MIQQNGPKNNILNQLNKEQYAKLVKQVAEDIKMEQAGTSTGGFNASAIAGTIHKYSGSCLSIFNSST